MPKPGKAGTVHCPKAEHHKHLVVCALACPFRGGNQKCAVYKRQDPVFVQSLVDEYHAKQEKKETEDVPKAKARPKAKAKPKPKAKAKPKRKEAPANPQFVFVNATGELLLLTRFDPVKDDLPAGRVYELGAEIERVTIHEPKRRKTAQSPKPSDKPPTAKPRKRKPKPQPVAEEKPALKVFVPKRRTKKKAGKK